MRYKHVFFIWLIANAFLAAGFLLTIIFTDVNTSADFKNLGFVALIIFFGLLLSMPSLIALMFFHAFYSNDERTIDDHVKAYTIAIAVINILYLAVSKAAWPYDHFFDYLYIFTTLAGLLALYLVQKRIKRNIALQEEADSKEGSSW